MKIKTVVAIMVFLFAFSIIQALIAALLRHLFLK